MTKPLPILRLRVYRCWKQQRAIVHDGHRWRRVAEPWQIDRERSVGWEPDWASDYPLSNKRATPGAWETFLTAPGFVRQRVDETVFVTGLGSH